MVIPFHEAAKIEALFSRHGEAWRLYVHGWIAPYVKQKLDQHGEAFPVPAPNPQDLHEYMWGARRSVRRTTNGSGRPSD